MKETTRYVGPDGEALHPGDRIGLEPPGCLKRDDGIDAWLTALRHEMARACELPAKVRYLSYGGNHEERSAEAFGHLA